MATLEELPENPAPEVVEWLGERQIVLDEPLVREMQGHRLVYTLLRFECSVDDPGCMGWSLDNDDHDVLPFPKTPDLLPTLGLLLADGCEADSPAVQFALTTTINAWMRHMGETTEKIGDFTVPTREIELRGQWSQTLGRQVGAWLNVIGVSTDEFTECLHDGSFEFTGEHADRIRESGAALEI
jgi:hypothetical protein